MSATDGTSRHRLLWKVPLLAVLGVVTLGWGDELIADRAVTARDIEPIHGDGRGAIRVSPIRGTDFPDGVLALTWDDGPDVNTLELARFLHVRKISGSFFVVGEWIDGVSEEPGVGTNVFATGYKHLPVLEGLVTLGQRIGSHTENHALVGGATASTVAEQLGQGQHEIDPFLGNELRMFRAPGGYWSRASAAAIADPFFADVVGPFHWDIDGKDWESSLYCRATPAECEPGPIPGRSRVRPDVVAKRYLARAESERHGIVLLHDRVGHVGSRYAIDVAHHLIPALEARGFVFGPPVLAFGPLTRRFAGEDVSSATFADLDGDHRDDLCRETAGSVVCVRSESVHDAHAIPRAAFGAAPISLRLPSGVRAIDVADVDGDGHADVCVVTDEAIDCAGSADSFAKRSRWSTELTSLKSSTYAKSFRLADIDGDGRADACMRGASGLLCATSTGHAFAPPRVWLDGLQRHDGTPLELADVDGDGRADVCGMLASSTATPSLDGLEYEPFAGITCALSNGHAFGTVTRWSVDGDFEGHSAIHLADLNGDGRADLCAPGKDGVACALSGGHGFKHASIWSRAASADIRFADLNGDGRADLCVVAKDHLDCGLAP